MEKKITGIVLKKVEYKESDAIITILGNDNFLYVFKARGILKPNSKNAIACNYFVIGEYLLSYKTIDSYQLKSASVIKMFHKPYDDLAIASSFMLILDITNQIATSNQTYNMCLKYLNYLEENKSNSNVLINYFKDVITLLGYTPTLGCCVLCQSQTNIISFDFKEGGFICKKCFNQDYYKKLDAIFLKDINDFFKAKDFYDFNREYQNQLLNMFIDFFSLDVGLLINKQLYSFIK